MKNYSIENLKLNDHAKGILSEIDAMINFCGRKPEKVDLLPSQFDRIKQSACSVIKKQIHTEAKAKIEGKRLQNGLLGELLSDSEYPALKEAIQLNYKGVVIQAREYAPLPAANSA